MRKIQRKRNVVQGKISKKALADFLFDLSLVYDNKETGNPALANALTSLANEIRNNRISALGIPKRNLPSNKLKQSEKNKKPLLDEEVLRNLSKTQVDEFIKEESRSKNDLLQLASVRFGMPTSQLKRKSIHEVRNDILSALNHETSIEILSQEAKREGILRNS